MSDLATRKQRLRTLENEIREGLLQGAEAFYYAGMKIKEIRDDELYDTEGFPSWTKYLESERLGISEREAFQRIKSAEYRHAIGVQNSAATTKTWSHHAMTQITRIPDLRDAARVAKKAESQAEKKGVKLTGSFVREIVNHELDREPRQPRTKTPPDSGDGNVHVFLDRYRSEIEGMREALEDVPQAGWTLLNRSKPLVIKNLISECERLAGFLKEKTR